MKKVIKYRVYMQHVWGGSPIKLRLFDKYEDAKKDAEETKDSMYDAFVVVEEQ